MVLSVHTSTLCYWGLSSSGGQGTACVCTYLESLLVWWRTGNGFPLYIPGLSAGGGHGDGSLCTNLESLPVDDREILIPISTWTLC